MEGPLNASIVEAYDVLPPQLQTAARYMLDRPDDVALLSMREQARRAGVPPATMTRLAKRLGLDGYDSVRELYAGAVRAGTLGFAGKAGVQVEAQALRGERALAAEMAADGQARLVLSTVGAGERTFTAIGQKAGGLQQASLSRALALLRDKRVVAADQPLSTKASKETRYRVADPYLRFWLTFIGPHMPELERARGDRVLERIRRSWTSWRGRAVEPVIRDSVDRLPAEQRDGAGGPVGGYWTRSNDPEIDLVIADRAPVAKRIQAVGSIKWLENEPFDVHDLATLVHHRTQLPGATDRTPLLAVSRSGCNVDGIVAIRPDDLLHAWQRPATASAT